ncbi:ParB/RepB/Spo0J family partition protein [Rathayibacter tritici]|uniref:ParB/RepB/Spo0J family partition protein n=1 Tax=Rathayibacter tritici TaxID=33888 RepID=UPI0020138C53|nr:ParB N-terminal domain-containing protein [Rathayibacter tritici]
MTPVLARRDEHGTVTVRAGQRRTLAAREAGVATIPVYVVEGDETTADRIVQQIIENDQRTELSLADRTAAWAQLAFEGVTAAAIAKRTGTQTDAVKKGLAVAESKAVTSVLHEHELTLDQAAVLLEFEDDAALLAVSSSCALRSRPTRQNGPLAYKSNCAVLPLPGGGCLQRPPRCRRQDRTRDAST